MKLNKGFTKDKEDMMETEKLYGVLEYTSKISDDVYQGEGKIGDYTLSSDFIEKIKMDSTWEGYDNAELEKEGYT